ncbi:hypothetical protein GJ25_gp004 [Mycobacterium phage Hawkeye]|uniref:Uncharacterized protein n=1 Tax=Mycobacterium phage Hawkeye TaxID=1458711 RepID=X2KSY9_9CAUD|nr:hypothetical protein GJ25_gp004 [Mycobacterium phage Hawkeye]AHN84015.1 hypothetical protein PBI_HAWKEYE_4 [Mycobacterium phage Hawkeye]
MDARPRRTRDGCWTWFGFPSVHQHPFSWKVRYGALIEEFGMAKGSIRRDIAAPTKSAPRPVTQKQVPIPTKLHKPKNAN